MVTMLVNRKTSFKGGMPMADYGPEENLNDNNSDIEWFDNSWVSINLIFFYQLYI